MPQNVNNIMVAAGGHINFTATPRAPQRQFRVEKKRKESKKAKKLAFQKPEGLRAEADRLQAYVDKEEEGLKAKKAKIIQLRQEADELEKKEKEKEKGGKGEDVMDVEGGGEGDKTLVSGVRSMQYVDYINSAGIYKVHPEAIEDPDEGEPNVDGSTMANAGASENKNLGSLLLLSFQFIQMAFRDIRPFNIARTPQLSSKWFNEPHGKDYL